MDTATLNPERVDAFARSMIERFNGAATTLMISVGHRVGLFDAMAQIAPGSSDAVARAAGLNERYVHEWLGAMVTGGIVEFDLQTGNYDLPAEHAACLTRAAAPANLAVTAQFIPLLGAVEDQIVECFRSGGGVPYSAYTRFHEVMAEESAQTVVAGLDEFVLPLIPGLVEQLHKGIDVLDVGCGSGLALLSLAAQYPNSRFTGFDFSAEAIGVARTEARRRRLDNFRAEVRDVTDLGEHDRYDLITSFDAIHDQAKPAAVLAGIRAALRDDGVYLMQEIRGSSNHHADKEHPLAPILYTISCMHCMTVSLAQGGDGLGAMWGRRTAKQMLRDAGFQQIAVHELEHDIQNDWYVIRP